MDQALANGTVTVELDPPGLTRTLHAMLHQDTGEMYNYEFPDADPPATADDQVVVAHFSLEVLEGEASVEMAA